jgi:hypothetical protein
MTIFGTILTFTLSAAIAFADSTNEQRACSEKRDFFNYHKLVYQPVDLFLKKIFEVPSQLIIFGEEHSIHDEELWSYLTPAVTDKASGIDCIFLESGKGSKEDKALTQFQNGKKNSLKAFRSPHWIMRWDNSMQTFIQQVKVFNRAGIKLIMVDDDDKQVGNILDNLNGRDESMARNILETFSKRQCTRGIYLVGTLHMLRTKAGEGRLTMTNRLEKAGLNVKTALIDVAGQLGVYEENGPKYPNQGKLGDKFVWQRVQKSIHNLDLLCRENPMIPDRPFGFVVDRQGTTNAPLFFSPNLENCLFGPGRCLNSENHDFFYGSHHDFDFVWIHRCMNKADCVNTNEILNKMIREKSDEIY